MGGRLAVDRLGHHETPAVVRVNQPAPGVLGAGLSAHRGKQRIVEFLRPRDVVTPDHNMAEHVRYLLINITAARRLCPTSRTRFAGWDQYDGAMIGKREKSLPVRSEARGTIARLLVCNFGIGNCYPEIARQTRRQR